MKGSNGKTQLDKQLALEEVQIDQIPISKTEEISMSHTGETEDRSDIIIDNIFTFQVAMDIMRNDEYQEPQTMNEYRKMNDWQKWKEAIQTELNSLTKWEEFGPVVQTPENIKPDGYKWVFVKKQNENDEIIRYKAWLVAQGFSQRPGIDYDETYSPAMDAITLWYLISLTVSERLDMCLMNVVTAYLYGSIDTNIYIYIYENPWRIQISWSN